MSKLEELYEDAAPGPWYISRAISDSICTKDDWNLERRIADLVPIVRKACTRAGQSRYQQVENARLIVTLYSIGPHVIKLMAAAEAVNNLNLRKALKALKDAIEAQPPVPIIDEFWKKSDEEATRKAALIPSLQLKDPRLSKDERRKLRRQLRKQRQQESASGSTD